ncbi:MAG: hypothetical protein LBH98_01455 [Chitinispirillales bacterium]|jgi:type II secretory pathway component GspD/PulD (secretin)|nr:hypothetical protein [Chitinispirillales bacterium]
MKKNNLHPFGLLLFWGFLLIPLYSFGSQLPVGKNNKTYAKWEWQDATLQSVVSHISAVSGVDFVADTKIASEKINILLRDKTWQDVIKIICQTKGFTFRYIDNSYVYIALESDLNEKDIRKLLSARNLEQYEELEKFTIKLKNTTTDDMLSPLRDILSPRGKAVEVKHTNSIIIHELAKNINLIKEFVDDMDREMLQISISAKIVEVSSGDQNGIGIQWSFFDGKGKELTHLPSATKGQGIIDQAFQKATYGVLDPKGFSIAMEYLFTETNSEIIAEPQITTLENKEARIFMGSQIPLTFLDYAGNTTYRMVDAGTELIVTPTVTGQGHIKMALNPSKKSYEMSEQGPVIHEQGAKTNVVVKDGETIVIAGLTSDDKQENSTGVPFLKDIPILGYFFKKHSKINDKRDLVIFVTPHIIKTTKLELLNEEKLKTEISPEPREEISDAEFFNE